MDVILRIMCLTACATEPPAMVGFAVTVIGQDIDGLCCTINLKTRDAASRLVAQRSIGVQMTTNPECRGS